MLIKYVVAFAFLISASTALGQTVGYLDIEDDQIISVFNKPGQNWKTCQEVAGCEAVGWPDNQSKIQITGPAKKVSTVNPYTNQKELEEYLPVDFEYTRVVNGRAWKKQGKGWIDAAYVSKTKREAFFTDSVKDDEKECPPQQNVYKGTVQRLSNLGKSFSNHGVREIADELDQVVGECAINPKNPQVAGANPYDHHVLPRLKKKSLPKVYREDGEMMTHEDLINIDALARTMYGEMASCYKHGLQYPMTVARIAVNRADDETRHALFIKDQHAAGKGDLAKVVTSPSQFSVWRKKNGSKINGPLLMAMCPPQEQGKQFWKGSPAPRDEFDIWKNTVRIATEAVLFPNRFKNRTIQVGQYFYTSGLGKFYNMTRVTPSIEGRAVSKNACVEVWKERR